MTDIVITGSGHSGENYQSSAVVSKTGMSEGYVEPADSPTDLAIELSQLDESRFNAFAESHSSGSFEITIDAGEGYVGGAWVARDRPTVVDVEPQTADQTVYLAWDRSEENTVVIDTAGNFDPYNPAIPLYDVDADGSGITAVRARHDVGKSAEFDSVRTGDAVIDQSVTWPDGSTTTTSPGGGNVGTTSTLQKAVVYDEGDGTVVAMGPESEIDSGADPTTVIQSAIDYVSTNGGGVIGIGGAFKVAGLVAKSNVVLDGGGFGALVLDDNTDANIIETASGSSRIIIRNLRFDGNSTNNSKQSDYNTQNLIRLFESIHVRIDSCEFRNAVYHAIKLDAANYCTVTDCSFFDNTGTAGGYGSSGIFVGNASDYCQYTDCYFENCTVGVNALSSNHKLGDSVIRGCGTGVYSFVPQWHVSDCIIQHNEDIGIDLDGAGSQWRVNGCDLGVNKKGGVVLTDATGVHISDCELGGNGGGGSDGEYSELEIKGESENNYVTDCLVADHSTGANGIYEDPNSSGSLGRNYVMNNHVKNADISLQSDSIQLWNIGVNDAVSTQPANPIAGIWYMDDGTNTSGGNPGLGRYNGASWQYVEFS